MGRSSGAADRVGGDVDAGYGKVADAFRANLTGGREVGAALAVYRDGVKVVDLWGGYRCGVTQEPWGEDTVVNLFSTTKGLSALAIAVAVSRGHLDYDATVTKYWPEFALAGKADVTVRQLLSHQAGLAAIDTPLTLRTLAEPSTLSAALAAQRPAWTPGTRHGYHAITLGWYESELLRRADPAHRSLGRYFAEEIAHPLDLDLFIGLPPSVDRRRVAHLHGWSRPRLLLHLNAMPPRFVAAMMNPRSLSTRAFNNPKQLGTLTAFNREDLRSLEIPAANGIGTARSVAKAYGAAASGGAALDLKPSVIEELVGPATPPTRGRRDEVLRVETNFSLGFFKPFPSFTFGSSDQAFGTPGAGGSFGFADPDTGVGFAYAMNKCGFHLWNDPRELVLRHALFHDVLKTRPQA